jgi:uroporphyrinogen decarboxylase
MNSKERVQTAFDHKEPDRVPITSWYTPEIRRKLEEKYCKKNSGEGSFFASDKNLDMELFLGSDVITLAKGLVTTHYRDFEPGKDTYSTEWGLLMKKVAFKSLKGEGYYTDIIDYPLKDKDNLSKFIPPNPKNEDFTEDIRLIRKYGKDYYISALVSNSIWEGYTYLRDRKCINRSNN